VTRQEGASRRGHAARAGQAVITAALAIEATVAAPLLPPAPEQPARPPRPGTAAARRIIAGTALLAVLLTAPACSHGKAPGPLARCPAGEARIRDVTRPPGSQWTCVR